ncbi:MFS transporter [Kiloniella sp.]|uniref:MFS transporter n=1 Tax=Kiloniella sp. TaxID=1938587 RepID=UPI003B026C2F
MSAPLNRQAKLILLLLFVGVFCNAMIVPFMGYFIVDGLGRDPWEISIYVAIITVLSLLINRTFGERFDSGARVRPMVCISVVAFMVATITLTLYPTYWVIIGFISLCFSLSGASTSLMYSFGRSYAIEQNFNITRYNSFLRTMTSLGWMFGPALSFFIASQWGSQTVFLTAASLAMIWFLVWSIAIPKGFAVSPSPKNKSTLTSDDRAFNKGLWLAVTACLFFAIGHVLTSSALPLYFTHQAGLPTYAPGLSFTIKCFMEVVAILIAPSLMHRIGLRNALCCAALLAMPTYYILSQVQTMPHLIIGSALEGLYYGIFAGVSITFVQGFANGRMGRATSLYMNSLFLGGMIGNVSMGLIASTFSYQTAIQLSLLCAAVALVVLVLSRRSDRIISADLKSQSRL